MAILTKMATIELMQLPLELFRAILVQSMLVRGIKRALRLRLVNRAYSLNQKALTRSATISETGGRFFRRSSARPPDKGTANA